MPSRLNKFLTTDFDQKSNLRDILNNHHRTVSTAGGNTSMRQNYKSSKKTGNMISPRTYNATPVKHIIEKIKEKTETSLLFG